mmetsp:Transcript_15965/g.34534  ORF Transcript_15965/g.34534 Transcript_15965/m.34534 type:complete len:134 (+) Transcript_15965:104-505(+)
MPAPFDDLMALPIPKRQRKWLRDAFGVCGCVSAQRRLDSSSAGFVDSESVAVFRSGALVMIDQRGFVFRAYTSSSSSTGHEQRGPPLFIGLGRPTLVSPRGRRPFARVRLTQRAAARAAIVRSNQHARKRRSK